MGLVSKLAEVMGTCGWVQKSGYNEFHKYPYAQEADIVNMLRGELARRQIMVFPDVKAVKRTEHTTETMKWNATTRTNEPHTRKTYLTEITVEWTFADGESGESRTISSHGVGEDNMDKGFYKAFTGCEKYMLMKTFLLPTGDDPEKDSQEEKEVAKQVGKVAAQDEGKRKVALYQAAKIDSDNAKVTIADLEKAIGNVPKEIPPGETYKHAKGVNPLQLTVVQVGEDKYEITGADSIMEDNAEKLSFWRGKRVRDPKTKQPIKPMTVQIDGIGLSNFRHHFEKEQHGELIGLLAPWAKS